MVGRTAEAWLVAAIAALKNLPIFTWLLVDCAEQLADSCRSILAAEVLDAATTSARTRRETVAEEV